MPSAAIDAWRPVGPRWFRHRPEPLLRERLWGSAAVLSSPYVDEHGVSYEAGFDREEVCVAWRQIVHGAETCRETVEECEPSRVVVALANGGQAETTLDKEGRALATVYTGREPGEERYHYDSAGRIVAIEEATTLWHQVHESERLETGGRLTVAHDDRGPQRIVDASGHVVWERPTLPWAQRLDMGAAVIADGCRALVAEGVAEAGLRAGAEAYGLALVYVGQGSLHPMISVGLEDDRRELVAAGADVEELATATLYVEGEALAFLEGDVPPDDLDVTLLREACMSQPADPYRIVLGVVVERLAREPLPAGLVKTADFVAWMAEHDEGFEEKIDAIRRYNPEESVTRWESGWGAAALQALALEAEWE